MLCCTKSNLWSRWCKASQLKSGALAANSIGRPCNHLQPHNPFAHQGHGDAEHNHQCVWKGYAMVLVHPTLWRGVAKSSVHPHVLLMGRLWGCLIISATKLRDRRGESDVSTVFIITHDLGVSYIISALGLPGTVTAEKLAKACHGIWIGRGIQWNIFQFVCKRPAKASWVEASFVFGMPFKVAPKCVPPQRIIRIASPKQPWKKPPRALTCCDLNLWHRRLELAKRSSAAGMDAK